jgi:ABC transporter substrate binding protein
VAARGARTTTGKIATSLLLSREVTAAGGLVSMAANLPELYERAAFYVDKILKGAKPADLPVQQPTKFQVTINMKTAQTGTPAGCVRYNCNDRRLTAPSYPTRNPSQQRKSMCR